MTDFKTNHEEKKYIEKLKGESPFEFSLSLKGEKNYQREKILDIPVRRNQEQRANRSSRWSGIEEKLTALMCLSYWTLLGLLAYCYIKFYVPSQLETNDFGISWSDSDLLRPSENVEESWKSALDDYINRHANKTAALVDRNEIKCPKMYSLSKNNKLCYFLAKYRERFDYLALLVNKSEAVTFCNAFSNGTVPYGKFMFNL